MADIQKYTMLFSTLHTAKVKGQKAPHKAILLLTIIDLVEKGIITSSCIELSEELVEGSGSIGQGTVPCPMDVQKLSSWVKRALRTKRIYRQSATLPQ